VGSKLGSRERITLLVCHNHCFFLILHMARIEKNSKWLAYARRTHLCTRLSRKEMQTLGNFF
jgi:hypothetical protein